MKNPIINIDDVTTGMSVILLFLSFVTLPIFQVVANAATIHTTMMNITAGTLGTPIFIEKDTSIHNKPIIFNGEMKGLNATFSGNGKVKGINFADVGIALITFRPDKSSDIQANATITITDNASDSEKATYTLQSIGHTDINGTTRDNGALFFHTNSTGKLADLDNMVIIFKDQVDKSGNGMTVGWEWK